jgi:hypothetical protein
VPPIPGLVPAPLPESADMASLSPATRPPSLAEGRRGELLWAPVPISNPAVGTGLAVAGAYIFAIDRDDKVSPPTLAALGGLYTSSGTWAAAAVFKTYLAEDRWRVLGVLSYGDVKTDYFGIGTAAGDTGTSVLLHQRGSYLLVEGLRRVLVPDLYAGLRYQRIDIDTDAPADTPPDILATLPGTSFSSASAGVGLRVQYDSRDNNFYPTAGNFGDLSMTFYAPGLGGDQRHQKYLLGANGYWTVRPDWVLAARVSFCGVGGEAPHYALCLFGSDGDIRGYKSGQYRDRAMFATQAELRAVLPFLQKKLGASAFFGFGEVAPSFGHLNASDVLFGGGLGVRYRVTKQDPINLRLEYAWGRGGGSFYLGVGEAF